MESRYSTMRELGSEFWNAPLSKHENDLDDRRLQYVLSGRTALDLIARDLSFERGIRSVCLPAYCCDSMIRPFLNNGFKISFYEVLGSPNGIRRSIQPNHGCGAVLLMNYFGFVQKETADLAEIERTRGTVVILDQVQSFYSDSNTVADYSVMSWRKWFFSCAAAATKYEGEWVVKATKPADETYVSLRKEAAVCKQAYIENSHNDKQSFLLKYGEAEERLDNMNFENKADPESVKVLRYIDEETMKNQRRANAQRVYSALADLPDDQIRPLFPEPGSNDTPLFVPVLVRPDLRLDLKEWLIHNKVYCPVHWADPGTGGGKDLFNTELSLICDQRYGKEDIQRQMMLIREFLNCHE